MVKQGGGPGLPRAPARRPARSLPLASPAAAEDTHIEVAIAHLSADPRLSPGQASSIASVIRQMYDALAAKAEPAAPLAACHLRAAPTLRPGVPDRLGGIIMDLHRALERRVAADGQR